MTAEQPKGFTVLRAKAAPLMRSNVDTDAIIPSVWMRKVEGDLGRGLFARWRYDAEGRDEPGFVLNRPAFRDAGILVAGRNFGCGSSRENAVWALLAFGIRCVVAPSFSDIFHENCLRNSLLPVTLDEDKVQRLAAELTEEAPPVTVDLLARRVEAPGGWSESFEIADHLRDMLIQGLDEITRSLNQEAAIADFQAEDRARRPWIYAPGGDPAAA